MTAVNSGWQSTTAVDGPKLLGTGGALRKALDKLGPEFMVMYGDSWLDTPYAPIVEAFRASRKPALMTVFRNDGRWDHQQRLVRGRRNQAATTSASACRRCITSIGA